MSAGVNCVSIISFIKVGTERSNSWLYFWSLTAWVLRYLRRLFCWYWNSLEIVNCALHLVNYGYNCSPIFDRTKAAANLFCHICVTNYTQSNKLKIHLQEKHNVSMVRGHSKRKKCTFPGCSDLNDWSFKNLYHRVNAQKEVVPCSRLTLITNSSDYRRVWTPNLLHTK